MTRAIYLTIQNQRMLISLYLSIYIRALIHHFENYGTRWAIDMVRTYNGKKAETEKNEKRKSKLNNKRAVFFRLLVPFTNTAYFQHKCLIISIFLMV